MLTVELWAPCLDCDSSAMELADYKSMDARYVRIHCSKSDVCKHIEGAEMLALGTDYTDDE